MGSVRLPGSPGQIGGLARTCQHQSAAQQAERRNPANSRKKAPKPASTKRRPSRVRDLIQQPSRQQVDASQPVAAAGDQKQQQDQAGPPWVGLADRCSEAAAWPIPVEFALLGFPLPLPAAGPRPHCVEPAAHYRTFPFCQRRCFYLRIRGGPLGDKGDGPTPLESRLPSAGLHWEISSAPSGPAPLHRVTWAWHPSLLTPEEIGAFAQPPGRQFGLCCRVRRSAWEMDPVQLRSSAASRRAGRGRQPRSAWGAELSMTPCVEDAWAAATGAPNLLEAAGCAGPGASGRGRWQLEAFDLIQALAPTGPEPVGHKPAAPGRGR